MASAKSQLPKELQDFFGPPPQGFEQTYLSPARKLKNALEKRGAKKWDSVIAALLPLEKSAMADIALFELSLAYKEKKQYAKSSSYAGRLLVEFPGSPYSDRLDDFILTNDCALAQDEGKKATGPAGRAKAIPLLQRCLYKTPWRGWNELATQAGLLYDLLKKSKDPLFGAFVTELIQALPASADLRTRIQKEIPDAELRAYADVARYRNNSRVPVPVKAQNPDADLFDQGMQSVLKGEWKEAKDSFEKILADYPNSEHADRAQYWIARSAEARGDKGGARDIYEKIFAENPLTYYGLQSALRLQKNLSLFLAPGENKPAKLEGALLSRQAIALWRLRAFLETGLIDHAREEAKFLSQHRPGGFAFGQYKPEGALALAQLFQLSGYPQGAFSQAYAALSLDASLLNATTLKFIFPEHYLAEFTAASTRTGVHPLLLLSLTKQESAFLPNALSRANAMGLMQLLPATAQEVDPSLKPEHLFEPEPNVRAGSRYLQKLLERFQGNIALALAGYNAGPTRAAQWQKKMLESEVMKKEFDVDIFIDTIPFTETRKYVGSILRNYAWYKLLSNDGKVMAIQELAFQWQQTPPKN